ncbi:DNA (cytosine-5-)-methyltransferase [Sporolactobacillus sp. THM7-7]|nr:DNA (cytosine-5-)-methyltransferase [Sporolactobacillus sp. THM7-7]
MKVILDKKMIRRLMVTKSIKTQKDLAKKMKITPNQLSLILSDNFCPIKSSIEKLVNILGEEVLKSIMIKTYQESFFNEKQSEFNNKFPHKTIDVSLVKPKKRFNALELFAGAGGLALALEKAGFNDVGLVEFDHHAAQTLRINRPNWNVIEEDITDITSGSHSIYDYISPEYEIDLLSGGYPCQSFSYAGKKRGLDDIRGTLFYHYAKIMKQVRPKMFLVENVRGLTTHDYGRTLKTMINVFEKLGYTTTYRVLNAWDYGIAEKRERMILIGIRNDLDITYQFPKPHDYKPVLRDVLKDVPDSPGQQYSESKRKVMSLVPPGGYWRDLPEDIAREYMGKSYYSSGGRTGMARRMSWDEPSLTLTTSPNQKQTERCHPSETRPFTTREYARIQGFPDSWQFYGGVGSVYKQIGNAVAVNFGKEIGLSIINSLNQTLADKQIKYNQLSSETLT